MFKRTIIASSVLLPLMSVLWLSFPSEHVDACTYAISRDERIAGYEQTAGIVFSGRVTGIARYPVTRWYSYQIYAIEVDRIWRGSLSRNVDVLANDGFCSDWWRADVGGTYKFYGEWLPGQPRLIKGIASDGIAMTTPDADCDSCQEVGGEKTSLIAGIALAVIGVAAVLILFLRRRTQASHGST